MLASNALYWIKRNNSITPPKKKSLLQYQGLFCFHKDAAFFISSCNKIHKLDGLTIRIYFFIVLKAGKSKINLLINLVPGGNYLLGLSVTTSLLFVCMMPSFLARVGGGGSTLAFLFTRTLIHHLILITFQRPHLQVPSLQH